MQGRQSPAGSEKTEYKESVTKDDNVTFIPENVTSSTHSIAQNSTAQNSTAEQSKEHPLFNSPLETAGEKAERKKEREEISSVSSFGGESSGSGTRKKWTQETIDRLFPPTGRDVAELCGSA